MTQSNPTLTTAVFYRLAVVKNYLIQKNLAARVLISSNYDAGAPQLLKKLNWTNLETRCQFLKVEIVYNPKIVNSFQVVTSITPLTCEILQISPLFPCHLLLQK